MTNTQPISNVSQEMSKDYYQVKKDTDNNGKYDTIDIFYSNGEQIDAYPISSFYDKDENSVFESCIVGDDSYFFFNNETGLLESGKRMSAADSYSKEEDFKFGPESVEVKSRELYAFTETIEKEEIYKADCGDTCINREVSVTNLASKDAKHYTEKEYLDKHGKWTPGDVFVNYIKEMYGSVVAGLLGKTSEQVLSSLPELTKEQYDDIPKDYE